MSFSVVPYPWVKSHDRNDRHMSLRIYVPRSLGPLPTTIRVRVVRAAMLLSRVGSQKSVSNNTTTTRTVMSLPWLGLVLAQSQPYCEPNALNFLLRVPPPWSASGGADGAFGKAFV